MKMDVVQFMNMYYMKIKKGIFYYNFVSNLISVLLCIITQISTQKLWNF